MECAILFGYSLCTQSSASRANRAACASSKSEAPIRPPHRISPATIDRIMRVSYPEFSFWTTGSCSVYPSRHLLILPCASEDDLRRQLRHLQRIVQHSQILRAEKVEHLDAQLEFLFAFEGERPRQADVEAVKAAAVEVGRRERRQAERRTIGIYQVQAQVTVALIARGAGNILPDAVRIGGVGKRAERQ